MPTKGQFVDLRTRLERNIQSCPASGCWLFIGKHDKNGYGNLHNRAGGGNHKAHRLSWQLYKGEIPHGMEIAHHCDVPCCVNPSHLYVATHKQNIADRTARKREPRGEKCNWSKLTKEKVSIIRNSDKSAASLSNELNVSKSQIYRVKNFENWNH